MKETCRMATSPPVRALAMIYIGIFLALASAGCDRNPVWPNDSEQTVTKNDAAVPLAWFDLQLKLVRESPGFSPPVASRAFGYSGVALYEAVAPGNPARRSLAGQLNGLTTVPQVEAGKEYNWPAAANTALASITRRLYANASAANMAAIDALQQQFDDTFKAASGEEVFNRSVQFGNEIADAVYNWSLNDGGHEGYLHNFPTSYTPPAGPGMWVPTPPAYSRAMQPYWGDNRPFVLKSGSECQPAAPPAFSEQPGTRYYQEALEIYNMVKNAAAEQKAIAAFWSDDAGKTSTPPGHSISILNQVIARNNTELGTAAEAYAKVGMAVADAFISCWHCKFAFNMERPITCIRAVMDSTWTPLLATPPFPEYTSGHSVQGAATAEVLTDLFGVMAFTDHTHDTDLGLPPRSFNSFYDAAYEAAVSRMYGGIHYRAACELGMVQGRMVGKQVNALKFRK